MAELKNILRQTLQDYAGEALNGYLYLTSDADDKVFTIVSIAKIRGETGIVAHIEHETIIIERDISNKPLVDALVQAGVPREQIVLAYAGEMAKTAS